MSKFYLFIIVMLLSVNLSAQTIAQKKSVLLNAKTDKSQSTITLNWEPMTDVKKIIIYRKSKTDRNWGVAVADDLPATTTSWTDKNIVPGEAYEYQVQKVGTTSTTEAFGYIYAGIELPEVYYRGKILLVFDTISTATLNKEIDRWIDDVNGDGWEVIKIAVNQKDAVPDVKAKILKAFNSDKEKVKSVFLLGRVPVPYSGNIYPDGHANHQGAWPADGFYAELTGNWTDNYVNNVVASDQRNKNIPADGKYDQNLFPTTLELQIGRVDMGKLTAFKFTETQLIKKYLDKNHAYRNKHFSPVKRGLIDDNFTGSGEGFASSGWRNFSALFGFANIVTTDYFTTMKAGSYLWSYGCGSGSNSSCGGVGTTADFAKDSLQSVFTMLFGSGFGDWDNTNNLLRASLANGSTLTNCWAGRPHWYFHHMGLGENIGFSAFVSMNDNAYHTNYGGNFVHTALMGDPTLRADMIAPPKNLVVKLVNGKTQLSWTASTDSVSGYHVFRKSANAGFFEKINAKIVGSTNYTDVSISKPDNYVYMVRAVKLQKTNSGSYFNMSTGLSSNQNYNNPTGIAKLDDRTADSRISIHPNPTSNYIVVDIQHDVDVRGWCRVYNIMGNEVLTTQLKSNRAEIALEHLSNGMYFVQVQVNGQVSTKRVLLKK